MSYQRGDRILTGQNDRVYHLRLTFGALAQVCDVLGAGSFSALAEQMRKRPKEAISVFADAMLNAAGCEAEVDARDLPKLSEAVSGMIESSFRQASGDFHQPSPKGRGWPEGSGEGIKNDHKITPTEPYGPTSPSQGEKNNLVSEVKPTPSIPFTSWLKIAVQIFRLSPSEFWTMSVSDFFVLLPEPQTPPGRETLSQLMTQFPDEAPT